MSWYTSFRVPSSCTNEEFEDLFVKQCIDKDIEGLPGMDEEQFVAASCMAGLAIGKLPKLADRDIVFSLNGHADHPSRGFDFIQVNVSHAQKLKE